MLKVGMGVNGDKEVKYNFSSHIIFSKYPDRDHGLYEGLCLEKRRGETSAKDGDADTKRACRNVCVEGKKGNDSIMRWAGVKGYYCEAMTRGTSTVVVGCARESGGECGRANQFDMDTVGKRRRVRPEFMWNEMMQ